MKNGIIFSAMVLSFQLVFSQNSVPNPSFENTSGTFCGIMSSADFGATVTNWSAPTMGSPDLYFTNIATDCWNFQPTSTYPGPIGIKGSQLPRTGDVMAGLFVYTIPGFEQREYIHVPLNTPLVVGGKYVVECYVSLADSTEFASDQLGMYLSTDPVWGGSDNVLNLSPQVIAPGVITDTQEWVRIADTITCTIPFSFLTIGSFAPDAQTNTIANPTSSGKPGTYGSYYFVDDVRIERILAVAEIDELHSPVGEKTLLRITDLMGRTTEFRPGTPLFYIFTDGSVECVLTVE